MGTEQQPQGTQGGRQFVVWLPMGSAEQLAVKEPVRSGQCWSSVLGLQEGASRIPGPATCPFSEGTYLTVSHY